MASILENHHVMKQEGIGAWRIEKKKAKDEPQAAVHK